MKEKKPLELKLKDKSCVLVLVAHPDDEVIWLGGTIERFKNINWTVFSLCRQSDKDREPKFRRVCKELNVKGIITDVDDEDNLNKEEMIKVFKKNIANQLKDKNFDICFTHNLNGEYGHEGHINLHLAVKELIKEKKFFANQVYFFNYKKIERKILPMVPAKDSTYILDLTNKEYERKRKIVAEIYGYPYNGIDVNFCTNIEAFKKN